jgi:hypothetical protein
VALCKNLYVCIFYTFFANSPEVVGCQQEALRRGRNWKGGSGCLKVVTFISGFFKHHHHQLPQVVLAVVVKFPGTTLDNRLLDFFFFFDKWE